jgi:hypothetical protein
LSWVQRADERRRAHERRRADERRRAEPKVVGEEYIVNTRALDRYIITNKRTKQL